MTTWFCTNRVAIGKFKPGKVFEALQVSVTEVKFYPVTFKLSSYGKMTAWANYGEAVYFNQEEARKRFSKPTKSIDRVIEDSISACESADLY